MRQVLLTHGGDERCHQEELMTPTNRDLDLARDAVSTIKQRTATRERLPGEGRAADHES
jgi:hypothetical protein